MSLQLKDLVISIALAVLTTSLVWHLTIMFVVSLIPALPFPKLLVGIAFGTAFGEMAVVLLWCSLYFGLHFFESYKQSEIDKWKLQAAVKDAELRSLKSQMNPHLIRPISHMIANK